MEYAKQECSQYPVFIYSELPEILTMQPLILSFCPNMIFLEIDKGGGPHHITSISFPQMNLGNSMKSRIIEA